jgi:hypothetical protein
MKLRQHNRARGTVVLGVIGVLSAALVAAYPAGADNSGSHLGQLKHETVTPPPTDPGTTDTASGSAGVDGHSKPVPLVNSFSATLAFTDGTGHRVPVSTNPVVAVVTIKNTSTTTNSFGSAVISVAGGFTVCTGPPPTPSPCTSAPDPDSGFVGSYSGSSIQVHGTTGVAPGSSLVVKAWVRPPTPCLVTGLNWTVQVRQTSTFSGATFTGGPTTPIGYLTFKVAPTGPTQFNSNMDPAPVVTTHNACGPATTDLVNLVTLTDLHGFLTTAGAVGGVPSGGDTTFSAVQFTTAAFDQLDTITAQANGYTDSEPSASFLIAEKVQHCAPGNCPNLTLNSQPQTLAVITPTAGADDTLVIGSELAPDNTLCGAAASGISDSEVSSTISVITDGTVDKDVTITLAKALVNAISNNGAPFMSVCLRVPGRDDRVLSDCLKGGVPSPPPCVLNRGKNKANEVIDVQLTPGDPHLGVY